MLRHAYGYALANKGHGSRYARAPSLSRSPRVLSIRRVIRNYRRRALRISGAEIGAEFGSPAAALVLSSSGPAELKGTNRELLPGIPRDRRRGFQPNNEYLCQHCDPLGLNQPTPRLEELSLSFCLRSDERHKITHLLGQHLLTISRIRNFFALFIFHLFGGCGAKVWRGATKWG